MRIAYTISGHGFGHATRSIEAINALAARLPTATFAIRSAVPRWLFEANVCAANVCAAFEWAPVAFDFGVVERGPFDVDVAASVERLAEVWRERERFVSEESDFLREWRADLALTDISPIACEAAARAGVRAFGISNFGWDFIYRAFADEVPEAGPLADEIAAAYGRAEALLRLPFHDDTSAFRRIVDVPLVARRSGADRAVTRRELGLRDDDPRRVVLLLLRHDALDAEAWRRVVASEHNLVLCSHPFALDHPNLRLLDLAWQRRFLDLVGAADVVISKPGYGIVADCIAAGTPLVALPRYRFAEYAAFQRDLPGALACAPLGEAAFRAGDWEAALDAAIAAPPPQPSPATNGAAVVAEHIENSMSI